MGKRNVLASGGCEPPGALHYRRVHTPGSPRPQIDVRIMVSDRSPTRLILSRLDLPASSSWIMLTSFCEPVRHGTHLPHDSLRKNPTQLSACSTMLARSP